MIRETATQSENELQPLPLGGSLSSRARHEMLGSLLAQSAEPFAPSIPRGTGIPEEFRRLQARWTRLDRFVAEALERALSGQRLRIVDTEPEDLSGLPTDLVRLAETHPDIAIRYRMAFDFLEGALAILRRYVSIEERVVSA